MGALGLATLTRFQLGLRCDDRNGRNEVRANAVLRPGLLWGLAAALLGVVGGRVWSAGFSRGAGALMSGAMAAELSLGCELVAIPTGALGSMGSYP